MHIGWLIGTAFTAFLTSPKLIMDCIHAIPSKANGQYIMLKPDNVEAKVIVIVPQIAQSQR
jgi:hypothetical protein